MVADEQAHHGAAPCSREGPNPDPIENNALALEPGKVALVARRRVPFCCRLAHLIIYNYGGEGGQTALSYHICMLAAAGVQAFGTALSTRAALLRYSNS